jgi:hypothetical protein
VTDERLAWPATFISTLNEAGFKTDAEAIKMANEPPPFPPSPAGRVREGVPPISIAATSAASGAWPLKIQDVLAIGSLPARISPADFTRAWLDRCGGTRRARPGGRRTRCARATAGCSAASAGGEAGLSEPRVESLEPLEDLPALPELYSSEVPEAELAGFNQYRQEKKLPPVAIRR